MSKPVVFCTNEILYSIVKKYRYILQLNADGKDSVEKWMEGIYDLLFDHADVVIDKEIELIFKYSKDESSEFYNPHLKKLWKNKVRIKSNPQIFKDFKEKSTFFNSIRSELLFLNDNSKNCEVIRNDNGVFCYGEEELNDLKKWFSVYNMRLEREDNDPIPWGFLSKYRHHHNAAIISDNFLLKNKSVIDGNLIPILKSIIPKKLGITYDLAIFVKDPQELKSKFSYIIGALKKESLNNINLTIISTIGKYKYHDRKVLTNYFWIDVGAGLDRYGKVSIHGNKIKPHESKITIHPISKVDKAETGKQFYEIHSDMVKDFKNAFESNPSHVNSELRVIGSRTHRLLR